MNHPILTALGLIALIGAMLGNGCAPSTSTERKQTQRVAAQLAQAEMAVAPPRVTNFTQLRDITTILELADQNISTWAYYMDMHGELHELCEAKGYGLPYSTQTTNPMRTVNEPNGGDHTIPQPEPNGLYMPDSVAATWILCVRPDGKGFDPVYWEPDLVVSPFPLKSADTLKAD